MAGITRRQGLAMVAGLGVTACGGGSVPSSAALPAPLPTPSPSPSASPAAALPTTPSPSLHAIAQGRGLRFGSAYAGQPAGTDAGSYANPSYAALLEGECGLLVPENEMKWQALRPSATSFDFARFDAMVAYADAHGLAVRGHNLLWHQPKWMPRWAESHDYGTTTQEAERILTEHVRTVVRRYGDRIRSYDVVNEAVTPADATLYQTALSRALGGAEATLDLAFRTARAEAPAGTELVYNDYMSWEVGNDRHRAGVLQLLEGFRRRNVPVDALGIQSHLVTPGADAAGAASRLQGDWRHFLDAVTAMGYRLLITELDVRDNNLPADTAVRDRAVADWTRAYLDVTLSYPQLRDVLVWGMSDRYSWIEGFEPRPDGSRRRPTLYDDQFRAKPMRAAVADALAAALQR